MTDSSQREQYVSDGGVSWVRVPLSLFVVTAASLACGFLLNKLFELGWYLIILIPFLAAIGLGGLMNGFVIATRCRNYLFATVVGGGVGIGAYLAYFFFGMHSILPPGQGLRLDLLPSYISLRMATDVQEDVGKPNNLKNNKPTPFLNWMMFAFELGALTIVPANFGWRRSRRAYSNSLRRWAKLEEKMVAPYQGAAMKAALDAGTLADFMCTATPPPNVQVSCRLAVEWFWTDQDTTPLEEPIYASISDHYRFFLLKTLRYTLVRQVELTPREVLLLRPLLPRLAGLLDVKHPELQSVPAEVFVSAPEAELRESRAVAQVTPVPDLYRQKVRTKNYSTIVNLLGSVELFTFFGGVGLMALGGWRMSNNNVGPWEIASLAAGAVLFAAGTYVSQFCMGVRENRWIHRRLRNEISNRPDPTVDLNDPGLLYVAIYPRESFEKVKWVMSSDLALMRLDERRKELRLEGDCDRYLIPAAAIELCQPVCFFHPLDAQHNNQLWTIRMMIQRDMGEQELLLGIGHIDWWPRTNRGRKRMAESVCQQINQLRGVKESLDLN